MNQIQILTSLYFLPNLIFFYWIAPMVLNTGSCLAKNPIQVTDILWIFFIKCRYYKNLNKNELKVPIYQIWHLKNVTIVYLLTCILKVYLICMKSKLFLNL